MDRDEKKYIEEPKVAPRLGHGKGTLIGSLDTDVGASISRWAERVTAGQRLLITGDTHKEVKRAHKELRKIAKAWGLRLRYRFAREVKEVEIYIPPEIIKGTSTEYQVWALVVAREHPMTEPEKRHALLESVVKSMRYDEMTRPSWDEMPAWTRDWEGAV